MTLREKIALIVPTPSMTPEEIADAILRIPDIRDALDSKVTVCPNCGYSPL